MFFDLVTIFFAQFLNFLFGILKTFFDQSVGI